MKVKTTSRTWITPSIPTREHWLSLSNLDRVVNPTFVSVLFFYEDALSRSDYAHLLRTLKDSLRQVLVQFHPLAGRLAVRDDGLVDLKCNDAGAMFLEARVDSSLVETGGRDYAQPFPALSGLDAAKLGPGPAYVPDQLTALPVLVVQLTRFSCGSVALAVNWHHTVADGFSGCHFVNSWAEVARREPLSLEPVHCREALRPRAPLDPSLVRGGYSTRKAEDLERGDSEPPILRVFHVGKEEVQKLRHTVIMEDQVIDIFQFSTVETISAYLWKALVRARRERGRDPRNAADANARTRFFMFVDGRKRLDLPRGYFGNVVCSACAVSDEAEIEALSLSEIAKLIRASSRSVTGEYFRSLIDWVEVNGLTSSRSEHVNSLGLDVAGTFWTYFPLYEIDFGWGRPTFAARNAPLGPESMG